MIVSACTNTGMCSHFLIVCVHMLSAYVQACHISVLCVYEGTCASVCNICCVDMHVRHCECWCVCVCGGINGYGKPSVQYGP